MVLGLCTRVLLLRSAELVTQGLAVPLSLSQGPLHLMSSILLPCLLAQPVAVVLLQLCHLQHHGLVDESRPPTPACELRCARCYLALVQDHLGQHLMSWWTPLEPGSCCKAPESRLPRGA